MMALPQKLNGYLARHVSSNVIPMYWCRVPLGLLLTIPVGVKNGHQNYNREHVLRIRCDIGHALSARILHSETAKASRMHEP